MTDKQANEYGGNNQGGPRYIVQQTVTVSSSDVDKIAKAGQKTAQLLQAGIIVVGGYGQGIRYVFNGLNALKPDMITEATKNARASADRFAADSGSQVGSIRSANQGVFSISAADAGSGMTPGEDGGWRRDESGCEHHEEGSGGGDGGLLPGEVAGCEDNDSAAGSFRRDVAVC